MAPLNYQKSSFMLSLTAFCQTTIIALVAKIMASVANATDVNGAWWLEVAHCHSVVVPFRALMSFNYSSLLHMMSYSNYAAKL